MGKKNSITNNLKACSLVRGFGKTHIQGRSQGGGVPRVHVHPPLKPPPNYFLYRIIRFYTNNPKCQYVYLSFYLNDYQIIEEWNWKISYFRQEVTFNLEKESTFNKKKYNMNKQNFDLTFLWKFIY